MNQSQLQAGTTLKQFPLEQTLIDNNPCLVFVKEELIPQKQYQINPLKWRNIPPRNQSPAPYSSIPQKTLRSVQSPATPWLN